MTCARRHGRCQIENAFMEWIEANKGLAIYAVPLAAFSEACVGIGIFTSGLFLVVICSYLHSEQLATLSEMVPLAFAGALLGDHSGFYFGRWIGPGLHHSDFGRRFATRIEKADAMIRKWGWGAILIGRFVPAIRSLVPVVTGVAGFGRVRYLAFDALACALWATGLVLILLGLDGVVSD